MKGSEIGIAAMVASLVLAVGTAYQWIQRVDDAAGGEASALARGVVGSPASFASPRRASTATSSR